MVKRWAMVVIVEAPDADAAMDFARSELVGGEDGPVLPDGTGVVYLGDPCSIGPAAYYETNQIALEADGELAVAAPDHVLEERRREHDREVDRLEGEGRR